VEALTLAGLRDRLRLALQSGDGAATYVLSVLVPVRLTAPDGDASAKRELRSLIQQARERFKDATLSELATEATQGRRKAGTLSAAVTRGKRQRSGQPAPFLVAYQRLYGGGPDIPWATPEKPKPRPPTPALSIETGRQE